MRPRRRNWRLPSQEERTSADLPFALSQQAFRESLWQGRGLKAIASGSRGPACEAGWMNRNEIRCDEPSSCNLAVTSKYEPAITRLDELAVLPPYPRHP